MIYPSNFEAKIGFTDIRTALKGRCLSTLGSDMVDSIAPSTHLQTIREQLAALPPEALCADDARAARLSACAACDHLRDGLCALCGCYVEYRAALLNRRCPDIPGRW